METRPLKNEGSAYGFQACEGVSAMLLNVNWAGSAFQFFNRPITIDAYDESITKHGALTEIIKVTEVE